MIPKFSRDLRDWYGTVVVVKFVGMSLAPFRNTRLVFLATSTIALEPLVESLGLARLDPTLFQQRALLALLWWFGFGWFAREYQKLSRWKLARAVTLPASRRGQARVARCQFPFSGHFILHVDPFARVLGSTRLPVCPFNSMVFSP